VGFDVSRLRRGELLAGAGAVLLLVFMLAGKWSGAHSGWQALPTLRWLVAVTIAAVFVLMLVQTTRRAPAIPVTVSMFVFILGVITVLALIYRVLINAPAHEHGAAYAGLVSALALAYGGYLSFRQEGIARRDEPPEIPVVRPGHENRS
jgi:hypothetical protein